MKGRNYPEYFVVYYFLISSFIGYVVTASMIVGIVMAFILISAAMLIGTAFGIIKKRQPSHKSFKISSTIKQE